MVNESEQFSARIIQLSEEDMHQTNPLRGIHRVRSCNKCSETYDAMTELTIGFNLNGWGWGILESCWFYLRIENPE